ncbi:hypothetical protein FGLOB1_13824 [Fusarium globosum]|uniref:Uncharacterized protein n=1 Tax=Fusarium globosum TaxID=78864 RepID=A0A8H5XLH3_9HYPO|nr:hypothetical protein FGLOB1_13824 [Fusarium globosum]
MAFEAGVEVVSDSIAVAAPAPAPARSESPAAGPGPATLTHWLEVPPTPRTPPGLISSSSSAGNLHQSTPRTVPTEVIDIDDVSGPSEPLVPTTPPSHIKELRRSRKNKRHRRPITRQGRAGRAFRWTPDLRGVFVGQLLDCKRLNILEITRAGALKPAFERVAREMLARKRYADCRTRWRQWLRAERSGTGPDADGRMQAPSEVFEHLTNKDLTCHWLRTEPLKNLEAWREVFAKESATGENIREAGEEQGLPATPAIRMGSQVTEILDLTSEDEDIVENADPADPADPFGAPPRPSAGRGGISRRGYSSSSISRRSGGSSSISRRSGGSSRRPRPATVLAAEALGDSLGSSVEAALSRLERTAEVLVRAEPAELVANATRVMCGMKDQLSDDERLRMMMAFAADLNGTLAAAFLAMDEGARVDCVRRLLEE